jgi:hypothetical protein
MKPIKIIKTCYSKIAIKEYLIEKEGKKTLEEYQDLFIELARVLFEIDNCETKNELNDKFNNGILNPVGTEEHKKIMCEDIALYGDRLTALIDFDYSKFEEAKYTYSDAYENLCDFKFL